MLRTYVFKFVFRPTVLGITEGSVEEKTSGFVEQEQEED